MKAKYLVAVVKDCPGCGGYGRCPPDGWTCRHCNGTGRVRDEVEWAEALAEHLSTREQVEPASALLRVCYAAMEYAANGEHDPQALEDLYNQSRAVIQAATGKDPAFEEIP